MISFGIGCLSLWLMQSRLVPMAPTPPTIWRMRSEDAGFFVRMLAKSELNPSCSWKTSACSRPSAFTRMSFAASDLYAFMFFALARRNLGLCQKRLVAMSEKNVSKLRL